MLQNAYFHAKIGADTAENEQHSAEILQNFGGRAWISSRLVLAARDVHGAAFGHRGPHPRPPGVPGEYSVENFSGLILSSFKVQTPFFKLIINQSSIHLIEEERNTRENKNIHMETSDCERENSMFLNITIAMLGYAILCSDRFR